MIDREIKEHVAAGVLGVQLKQPWKSVKIVVDKLKRHFLSVAAGATCCQISLLWKDRKGFKTLLWKASGASVMGSFLPRLVTSPGQGRSWWTISVWPRADIRTTTLKCKILSELSLQGSCALSGNAEVHPDQHDCQAETQGRQRHLKAAGSSALKSWQCSHLVIRVCLQVSPTILFLPAADKHV